MLVFFAIAVVVSLFVAVLVASRFLFRKEPAPNHAIVHRRYSYRSDPHSDQTTALPNRLSDNEVTDR
ncbi:MAG: hypothetical protein ACLFR7_03625 [Opitutales bacterium]